MTNYKTPFIDYANGQKPSKLQLETREVPPIVKTTSNFLIKNASSNQSSNLLDLVAKFTENRSPHDELLYTVKHKTSVKAKNSGLIGGFYDDRVGIVIEAYTLNSSKGERSLSDSSISASLPMIKNILKKTFANQTEESKADERLLQGRPPGSSNEIVMDKSEIGIINK